MKTIKRIIPIIVILALLIPSCVISFAEGETDTALITLDTEVIDEATTEAEALDSSKYIRIGLYWGENCKQTITLESEYGFILYDENGYKLMDIPETSLTMDISSEYLAHKEGRIFMSAAENEDDRIVTMTTDSGTKKYRDGIWLYENSGLRIINYVTFEHYVWGVVNCEMSKSYPLEALKAQAVAARTYAMFIKGNRAGHYNYGFDLCTTQDCQVYRGVSSESDITTQACKETEGLIMTYDGQPVYALFSAYNAGGYSMSIYDAWGIDEDHSKYPYLVSVSDPYTPVYTWATTYTFEEMRTRIIEGLGKDPGTIYKVEIADTNSFGSVTGMKIYCDAYPDGLRIPRSQIQSVFHLKSKFFCIGDDEYNEIETVEATPATYTVATSYGDVEMSTSQLYVCSTKGINQLEVKTQTTYSMTNDVCETGYVYMNGMGYGHGIGLSQVGARNMARDYGYNYEYILKHYYTGVTIEHY